jgi:hypothetical protein
MIHGLLTQKESAHMNYNKDESIGINENTRQIKIGDGSKI